MDAIQSIRTMTRLVADRSHYYPQVGITREEAWNSFTMANSDAAFGHDNKPMPTSGKLANNVVFLRNTMSIAEGQAWKP